MSFNIWRRRNGVFVYGRSTRSAVIRLRRCTLRLSSVKSIIRACCGPCVATARCSQWIHCILHDYLSCVRARWKGSVTSLRPADAMCVFETSEISNDVETEILVGMRLPLWEVAAAGEYRGWVDWSVCSCGRWFEEIVCWGKKSGGSLGTDSRNDLNLSAPLEPGKCSRLKTGRTSGTFRHQCYLMRRSHL